MERTQEAEELFFEPIKNTLFFQMHRLHTIMFRFANRFLEEEQFPIRSEQFPVLITIYMRSNLSQQEVADLLHRDKSSVQRTILALQKKGLVAISQDPSDKRKNRLCATSKGAEIALRIRDLVKKVEAEISQIFDENLAKNHIESLKVAADSLERLHKTTDNPCT